MAIAQAVQQATTNDNVASRDATGTVPSTWCMRYANRHRLTRLTQFPASVPPPQKVRIYARREHHVLQFWDPSVRKTLSHRVEGDLIDALAEARRIDQRLLETRRSGRGGRGGGGRVSHADLVRRYQDDLQRRVEAGVISLSTASRYGSALQHYLNFADLPRTSAAYPHAGRVNRAFALDLMAHLNHLQVTPNGRTGAIAHRMQSCDYVLDVVRALFEWATDPEQGNLLPALSNPFRRKILGRRRKGRDLVSEPDITPAMAQNLLNACDDYQLRLLAPLVFYGLRPGELLFAFHEHLDSQFLSIECIEALGYLTKGKRNKRLPMLDPLYALLRGDPLQRQGLIFLRRHEQETKKPDLLGVELPRLIEITAHACRDAHNVQQRQRCRDQVLRRAGATSYKRIEREFQQLARSLEWPKAATLKDLRHLCNTLLANGGMSETERRYLLGHDLGRAAILNYTHLNRLGEHYRQAVEREMSPLLQVLQRRVQSHLTPPVVSVQTSRVPPAAAG